MKLYLFVIFFQLQGNTCNYKYDYKILEELQQTLFSSKLVSFQHMGRGATKNYTFIYKLVADKMKLYCRGEINGSKQIIYKGKKGFE